MAQDNSYVSDDSSNDESDVETDETSEMITLLHNQQDHLIKQNKEIKTLKAKEKLHASGWRTYGWNRPIWVPKDIIHTMNGSQKVWIPKT